MRAGAFRVAPVLLAMCVGVGFVVAPAMGQQTATVTVNASDPDQKIKCRKYLAPGSLVRKVKMCRTIAEWRKAAQAGNDAARYIVGENVCSGGDCRGYEPPDVPE
jgi:hypothetical protein